MTILDPSTPYSIVSAATTNATSVRTAGGFVILAQATNSGAGWAYLKIYDTAGVPNVGTDTPIWRLGLPPGGGSLESKRFFVKNGFAFAIVGGTGLDSDTTAVAAGQVLPNFLI